MRKAALMTAALLIVASSIHAFAGTPKVKRYKIKSGIVEMALLGTESGTEITYFDDWGWKEAKYKTSVLKVAGFTQETKTLTLLDGEWTYSVDLNTNMGSKMKTPLFDELNQAADRKGEDLTDSGMEMMKQMGGKKTGAGVVAGKNCDIWEIASMGTKTWIWNGLTLKIESGFGGINIGQEAKSLKLDVAVPADKLQLPANAKITDGPDISNIMKNLKRK